MPAYVVWILQGGGSITHALPVRYHTYAVWILTERGAWTAEVPDYLQWEGTVRNAHFSKQETEVGWFASRPNKRIWRIVLKNVIKCRKVMQCSTLK